MTKLKKRGTLWRSRARRIETAIEASYFARRFGLTKEEAVSIIKDAAAPNTMERADAPPKRL
ncbi:hypothetical protein [Mesorhizobium retamae]|uniref:DUF3606 domain-containing protein n=1 Tax=Mesorhizobium retamae TaxID=2912854 RepID=A0ABS9QLP9_9HYPH|nr:hypothetical protein [Mesorhizobium sp. IRAMC:0171]MCG7508260.1 hypothetical protein [Mesorhizobium sp. IRAMC:0171]